MCLYNYGTKQTIRIGLYTRCLVTTKRCAALGPNVLAPALTLAFALAESVAVVFRFILLIKKKLRNTNLQ